VRGWGHGVTHKVPTSHARLLTVGQLVFTLDGESVPVYASCIIVNVGNPVSVNSLVNLLEG